MFDLLRHTVLCRRDFPPVLGHCLRKPREFAGSWLIGPRGSEPETAGSGSRRCSSLSLRQVVEIIAAGLSDLTDGLEIVSMPYELAIPARPLVALPLTTHRVVSIRKLELDLGYQDVVSPREALVRTARWLVENRPEPGGLEETILQDPFDYPTEDRLVEAWRSAESIG